MKGFGLGLAPEVHFALGEGSNEGLAKAKP